MGASAKRTGRDEPAYRVAGGALDFARTLQATPKAFKMVNMSIGTPLDTVLGDLLEANDTVVGLKTIRKGEVCDVV